MFQQQLVSPQPDLFQNLQKHVFLEEVGKGRLGAILVQPSCDGLVPLVRSTTQYQNPMRHFHPIHADLATRIEQAIGECSSMHVPPFNNMMMELYTSEYQRMGYHTDQSLDLLEDSWICLFSCYKQPELASRRLLRVQQKETGLETDFVLEHNSFVFFSTKTNAVCVHKIILNESHDPNMWLGLTFRTSKTFLQFDQKEKPPRLWPSNEVLGLATQDERRQLCRLKGAENRTPYPYPYPPLKYTISLGDLMEPISLLQSIDSTGINQNPSSSSSSSTRTSPSPTTSEETSLMLNCVLVLHNEIHTQDTKFLIKNFAGTVVRDHSIDASLYSITFLAGDIATINLIVNDRTCKAQNNNSVFIIKELSTNYDESTSKVVSLGQVPININGLGILFRRFFNIVEGSKSLFDSIQTEHQFQNLTESNKANVALRTGLYITDVTPNDVDGDLTFHLLRCSSNFTGPTEGFGPTDREILENVNRTASLFFHNPAPMNHVLAQIYNNTSKKKASIKRHSDKTKDMPSNGLIAFCTFYHHNRHPKVRPPKDGDLFDLRYKETSVLTNLKFRLKHATSKHVDPACPKEFDVKLYPDSVFIMSLSTNRRYTHEICPSILPGELLPTRLGYVIRCSKTEAVFKTDCHSSDDSLNGSTFVKTSTGTLQPLERPTLKDIEELRNLYFVENTTDRFVNYGDIFYSMNYGDYQKPII